MYDVAVFIGRFQPFHKGHLHNILKALSLSKRIIINVGSSFCASNIKNPFSFEQRKQMIESDLDILGIDLSLVKIEPLADYYYQEQKWENDLRANVNKHASFSDSIVVVGHQKDASSYYLKSFSEWDYLSVDNYKNYNATDFRKQYYKGNILAEYMCCDNPKHGAHKILCEFMLTDQYSLLKEENQLVVDYKAKWAFAPHKPIFVTVDALVVVNGHILLIQRKQSPGKNLWALPGGFLDHGELIAQAIVRELYEETNVNVSTEQLALANRGNFVFDYPSRSIRGQTITHVGLFVLEGCSRLPNIAPADDAKVAKWIDTKSVVESMHDKMFEDHYQIITILLEQCGKIL
ncbi:bifunctional nicotinamide-nucleotide adenylyltransferase/Nudix hydroxylase [Allofrancisella guangzhouensis]|uniref:ADP-ribose pyrophosphatase n=1 Tax=Allofrancisella guangzhouensis TaxID=594679 RepID=A0A0A8E5Z3_9GAMM|nr:bifunctional nicotinamide-nucleotide adenylyltransferase/Nudix hydroxylase [Allofrancisella guangzhouensis]AJC49438.1 ADP-ribose pyrophosphatase [Allofrancisella guangzhouensis]MBK2026729.1 bifunctional nicotinamide-nucleotide adenylyltransferase/Nudix hydroxylase [Allofrancisella guangzhouensis]MBK2043654.1 bifunctional nicotinamide-nucleotide adenylyltransferase/Nudix hydroxylase [Allofrancisella guangzhouensis]MBK2046191.1 bifunctional nicotinamide-nucleotide adenylyltransferase/Nudix hyd